MNIGGWLNMENFITGHPANESMMRAVLGPDRSELFFERLARGVRHLDAVGRAIVVP